MVPTPDRKRISALIAQTSSFTRYAGSLDAFRGPIRNDYAIILILWRNQPRLAQQR